MHELKQQLLDAAKREGIDLIGFAPKSRFDAVDPAHNPFSIFPEGKTVILFGKRICRGSLRGVEEGTNFGDYRLFGNTWLEDEFLSLACYNLGNVLEDRGWEAVPLFNNPPECEPTGVPVALGRPAPNVYPDFDYAAIACGVCELGLSGLPLSDKFGSRQRFQMIITDAELESSPLLEESVCNSCRACADACPLGAISKTETEEITICGKTFTVGKIDYDKCKICQNGAVANRFAAEARPDRIAALCNRTCMCGLEARDALENKFVNTFRTSEAWSIGGGITPVDRSDEKANVLGGTFSKSGNRGH